MGPSIDPFSKHLLAGAGTRGPLVLVYHAIDEAGSPSGWPYAVTRSLFARHLDLLCDEGWSTVTVSRLSAHTDFPPRTVAITFDDGYRDNLGAIEELTARGMCATWFLLSRYLGGVSNWDSLPAARRLLMSVDDVRELVAAGMEIGSHGATHRRMTGLDDVELDAELTGSRDELSRITGTPVMSLAYPYGVCDERIIAAARRAGYLAACTTDSGWAMTGGDLFRMRRLTVVSTDTVGLLARKLAFAHNDAGWGLVGRYLARRVTSRLSTKA